jgi:hypothetical protein
VPPFVGALTVGSGWLFFRLLMCLLGNRYI